MSKRWKPGLNEVFWYINSGNKMDYTTNNGFGVDEEKIAAGNCFFTQAEAQAAAEKVKALLLSLPDKKQPKLTAEVFNRPDCPEWAKYAAVDDKGTGVYFENKPEYDGHLGCWLRTDKRADIIKGKYDASDWKNSLIERPATLPDWCKVGEWIYYDDNLIGDTYAKVKEVTDKYVMLAGDMGNVQLALEDVQYADQARLRPYNADEMRSLVGKVVTTSSGRHCTLVTACKQEYSVIEPQVMLNEWLYATDLLNGGNTIDGKPCGVLEHLENGEWVE